MKKKQADVFVTSLQPDRKNMLYALLNFVSNFKYFRNIGLSLSLWNGNDNNNISNKSR